MSSKEDAYNISLFRSFKFLFKDLSAERKIRI